MGSCGFSYPPELPAEFGLTVEHGESVLSEGAVMVAFLQETCLGRIVDEVVCNLRWSDVFQWEGVVVSMRIHSYGGGVDDDGDWRWSLFG